MRKFLSLALFLWPTIASAFAGGQYAKLYVADNLATFPTVDYSVRLLTRGYRQQPLEYIRRSTDNSVRQEYAGNGGILDVFDIINFSSGGNCYLTNWKDQGGLGSSADAIQTTAANQPQICASGVVETQNGVPTVYFNGSTKLATPAYTAYSSGIYNNVVGAIANNTTYPTFSGRSLGSNPSPIDSYGGNQFVGNGTSSHTLYNLINPISSASGFAIWGFGASAATAIAYYNGNSNTTPLVPSTYGDNNVATILGSRNDNATSQNGYTSEFMLFAGDPTVAPRIPLEVNQGQFFKIPGVTQ